MDEESNPFAPSPWALPNLSFAELVRALWLGRYVAAFCLAATITIGLVALRVMTPLYTASMTVTPKYNGNNTGLSGIASLYRSTLGGIGATTDPDFTLFKQSIGSVRLAKRLQNEHHLLQTLLPAMWDAQTHEWRRPSGPLAAIKAYLKAFMHLPAWSPPDYRDLAKILEEKAVLTGGGFLGDDPNVYRLSFTADDPKLAAAVLSQVYWGAEAIVRRQQREQLTNAISHLQDMLATQAPQDVRAELIQRILADKTRLALLQPDQPAATMILDPPFVPKMQSFPNPKLTLLFAAVFGTIAGVFCGILYGLIGSDRILRVWRERVKFPIAFHVRAWRSRIKSPRAR